METPREIGEQSGGFVIGMRGDIEDARGESGAVDGFDGFWETGACSWRRGKLRRRRLRGKRCEHSAEKSCSNGSKEESIHAASGSFIFSKGTFANGHCRILRAQIRNASVPSAISAIPHFLAVPVCQKSQAHPIIVITAGKG